MRADRYSRTALAAAFYRAQHHLHDDPRLLDDPYAHRLLTGAEMAAFADRRMRDGLELGVPPGDPDTVLARTLRTLSPASTVLARARYTEDRLAAAVARGVDQYVLVGAGLDTFAFRRSDLHDIRVFELDHPRARRRNESGSPPPGLRSRRTCTSAPSTSSVRASQISSPAFRSGPTDRLSSPGSG